MNTARDSIYYLIDALRTAELAVDYSDHGMVSHETTLTWFAQDRFDTAERAIAEMDR